MLAAQPNRIVLALDQHAILLGLALLLPFRRRRRRAGDILCRGNAPEFAGGLLAHGTRARKRFGVFGGGSRQEREQEDGCRRECHLG